MNAITVKKKLRRLERDALASLLDGIAGKYDGWKTGKIDYAKRKVTPDGSIDYPCKEGRLILRNRVQSVAFIPLDGIADSCRLFNAGIQGERLERLFDIITLQAMAG